MSSRIEETESAVRTTESPAVDWSSGAVAGLAGGVVMGVMLTTMMGPVIESAIPALFGTEGLVAGWMIHLFNSLVFGIVFAVLASRPPLREYADGVGESTGLGLAYGFVIWVVAAGVVMPIWLQTVGFPGAPPLPNFTVMSLVGHLTYGFVLGIVWAYSH